MSAAESKPQRIFPIRIVLFLAALIATVFCLNAIVEGVQTFSRLDAVERERDQWQRPSDVLEVMHLSAGNVAVDLGCGSGYFSLKLASLVGTRGRVLSVDIRRLPLAFLWARGFMHRFRNIDVIHGDTGDPHLPAGVADAVLIANTYHELADPQPILEKVFRSLRSEGRLVILDRGPDSANGESPDAERTHHHVRASSVEDEVVRRGFEIVQYEDRFIDRAGDEPWWLIVARKP
jgi:ubiquinone/menaquinone biosynthesis C-methylase UbiE